jgi:hypothetical protein
VCAFFKQGQCSKGDKCKFSHDLNLDRKGEKRSIYVDKRDTEEDLKNGKIIHRNEKDGSCPFTHDAFANINLKIYNLDID